jgi:hypothetical protein
VSKPETVFSELVTATPAKPGRGYRAFYGPPGLGIRAFIDGESRLPGLTLKVTRDCIPPGMQLPRIRGAQITVAHGNGEGRTAEVIYELSAAERAFSDVFIELAARLITDATSEATAGAALLRVARRVASWARFFDARGSEGLGRSAQLGLLGELLCLERLGALLSPQWAVNAWTGPTGTPHDFQAPGGAVEVKLTTSASPERFRITSERQLDDSMVPWLGLYAITAQEAAAGSVGLANVVDRIRATLERDAPGAVALFEERLMEIGYSDADRPRYAVRVTTRSAEFLHVHDAFPRVLPAELRPSVFAVSYDIPWSAIAPYRVSESEVRRVFLVAD